MADLNSPDFNPESAEAFSYEHLVALDNQNADAVPPSQSGDEEDIVDLTVNQTSALWGEVLGVNDIPLSPDQIATASIRGRHIRRH